MLAVRYHGIENIKVEDVAEPDYGPYEVLVRVKYAGICGSDLHIYRKGMFITSVPEIMGHEFVGVVEEVGSKVNNIKPGDYVVGDPRVSCGRCRWCREGNYHLCPQLGFIGEVSPGCFAEFIVMSEKKLFKVPEHVNLKLAALTEPLAVALHIAERGAFSAGYRLGIVGAGPIGLLTQIVAKSLYSIDDITVIDISPERLEIAKKIGAREIWRSIPESDSMGVDIVVEAAGNEATLNNALKWVNPGGTLVMAGIYENRVDFDPNKIVYKEVKAFGVNAYKTSDIEKAIKIIAEEKANIKPVITHVLPLESAAEGFAMLATEKRKDAVKVILQPAL